MKSSDRDQYIRNILDRYRATPGTRGRIRDADRRLAEDLYRRGIAAENVTAAMIFADARRTFRDPELGPLEPIGSLHYFLPVISEIQRQPIDHDYLQHIQHDSQSVDRKLNSLTIDQRDHDAIDFRDASQAGPLACR